MPYLISEISRVVKVCPAAEQALASLVRVCVCVRARARARACGAFHMRVVPTSPYLLFLRVCSPLFRLYSGSCRHEYQAFENSTVKFAF
jgi:hypothetical protein